MDVSSNYPLGHKLCVSSKHIFRYGPILTSLTVSQGNTVCQNPFMSQGLWSETSSRCSPWNRKMVSMKTRAHPRLSLTPVQQQNVPSWWRCRQTQEYQYSWECNGCHVCGVRHSTFDVGYIIAKVAWSHTLVVLLRGWISTPHFTFIR